MGKDSRNCIKVRLKEIRARLNLRQEDLAKMLGVTRQTIVAIEKGRYYPSLPLALKMAKKLGLKVEDIFVYEENCGDEK